MKVVYRLSDALQHLLTCAVLGLGYQIAGLLSQLWHWQLRARVRACARARVAGLLSLGSSPSSDTGSCVCVCVRARVCAGLLSQLWHWQLLVCVCVCVCVWEREREREREFTSDPPWISVLWLYLLPGWPRGGVDKVPWKAGPGVLQVQIHDQLWALQEAVRSGTHLGTWNPGQDRQLIHRQVDLPFSKSLRPAHQTLCCLEGNDSVILCLRSEKAGFQCSPISV